MREFERDDAFRFEKNFHAGDEIVDIGHVRQHIVAHQQVGLSMLTRQLSGRFAAEKSFDGRDPLFTCTRRALRGRFDSQAGNVSRVKELQ